MLLSSSEFNRHARTISELGEGHVGFDFETTGLSAWCGDRAFIMGYTDEKGHNFCVRFEAPEIKEGLRLFFSNPSLNYCAHNIKFELSFLDRQFGVEVKGGLWDTEVLARVERNNHLSYALQSCAVRIKDSKYPPMLEWLKKRGNKNGYHLADPEIIEPYVEHDAWLSWELSRRQLETFKHWDATSYFPIEPVVGLEKRVTVPLFKMEKQGLLVDVGYCQKALEYEKSELRAAEEAFSREAGVRFVDSRKTLQPLFDARGISYGKTDLGNASFNAESLKNSKSHPLVRSILRHRDAKKRSTAYWENFLELEHNGIIHPSINQNRAATGRMSISEPSCQNWPRDDEDVGAVEDQFPVRRAFLARSECKIVSLDYTQMELRLICDEAEDMGMIDAFKNGADFHQQVADHAQVPRTLAKTGRFAKLYGAGIRRVAETLDIDQDLASRICSAIDENSPRVAEYSRELIRYACEAPFGYDFLGRRFFFDRGFEYIYPNYRIQGGCAEILKLAIIDVEELLSTQASDETFLLIPIHDELLINMHPRDFHLIPRIKRLMIAAHRSKKHLDMDVDVYWGDNFYDLEKYVHG